MTDSLNNDTGRFDPRAWKSDPEIKKKVLTRMFALREIFKNDLLGKWNWRGVEMNQEILAHAVHSYFVDLDRYKEFHSIKLADAHKRAAFTIKWIATCKPIQVSGVERKENMRYQFLANEVFAVHAGLNQMDISYEKFHSGAYFLALVYKLHFRPIIAETLISEMYAVDRAMRCDGL